YCYTRLSRLPSSTLFPYTTLFRSAQHRLLSHPDDRDFELVGDAGGLVAVRDHVPAGDVELVREYERDRLARHRQIEVAVVGDDRSEEHTSELQSQSNLVCRLLLEK